MQLNISAFIVPYGVKLKRTKESNELKKQRALLKSCLNKNKSTDNQRVYDIEEI